MLNDVLILCKKVEGRPDVYELIAMRFESIHNVRAVDAILFLPPTSSAA